MPQNPNSGAILGTDSKRFCRRDNDFNTGFRSSAWDKDRVDSEVINIWRKIRVQHYLLLFVVAVASEITLQWSQRWKSIWDLLLVIPFS